MIQTNIKIHHQSDVFAKYTNIIYVVFSLLKTIQKHHQSDV